MKVFVIFLFSVLLFNSVLGATNCISLKGVKEGLSIPNNVEDFDFEFINGCGQGFFNVNVTFLGETVFFSEFNEFLNVTVKNVTLPAVSKNIELFIRGEGLNQRFIIPFEIKPVLEVEKSIGSLQNNSVLLIESVENNLKFILPPLNKPFLEELSVIKDLNDFALQDFFSKNYSRSRSYFLKNLPRLINLGSRVKKYLLYELLVIGLLSLFLIFYVINIVLQKFRDREGNLLKE